MELHGREAEVRVHCAGVWAARESPRTFQAGAGGWRKVFPGGSVVTSGAHRAEFSVLYQGG